MAKNTIGNQSIGWIWGIYIVLFYSLLIVYAKGTLTVFSLTPLNIFPKAIQITSFLGVFVPCCCFGKKYVNKLNFPLVVGLFLSFLFLISIGVNHIQYELLTYKNWSLYSLFMLPILITSYGFHIIIPTIYRYLDFNKSATRMSILLGSSGTLLIYVVWQFFVMGIVPNEGVHGLADALAKDQTAIQPLSHFLGNSYVGTLGKIFGLFSLTTSFLGVGLALQDFMADGLKLDKTKRKNKLYLCSLIFLPPLFLCLYDIPLFYFLLNYGGGLGVTALLIFLPALMAKSICKKQPGYLNSIWFSIATSFLLLFTLLIVFLEIYNLFFK